MKTASKLRVIYSQRLYFAENTRVLPLVLHASRPLNMLRGRAFKLLRVRERSIRDGMLATRHFCSNVSGHTRMSLCARQREGVEEWREEGGAT